MQSEKIVDFYRVLDIQQDASQEEIKRAYHRALLRHHPDKKKAAGVSILAPEPIPSIDTLQEAFRALSSPSLKRVHDESLKSIRSSSQSASTAPRPANIVSLDDFDEIKGEETSTWAHPCRCGGTFAITELLLEEDVHLVGCSACSEAIWVGYEIQES